MKKIMVFGLMVLITLFQAGVVGAEDCTFVNQRDENLGGQWNLLFTQSYNAGDGVQVVLKAGSDGNSCADAVKFVKQGGGQADIIIDNQPGDQVSDWKDSIGVDGWDSSIDDFNSDKHHSIYSTSSNTTYTWSADIPSDGVYDIYASWTYYNTRDQSAEYCINIAPKITASVVGNGAITPSGVSVYSEGSTPTYKFKPDATHTLSDVQVDGASVMGDVVYSGITATYTFLPLSENHTIVATYDSLDDSCIRVDQGVNGGQWNLLGSFSFTAGAAAKVTVERDNTSGTSTCADAVRFAKTDGGVDIIVDNNGSGSGGFSNFSEKETSSGKYGYDPAISDFNPLANFSDFTRDIGDAAIWTATIPETGVYYVYASWSNFPDRDHQAPYCVTGHDGKIAYTVTAGAGANGSVTPSGAIQYSHAETPTYTFSPAASYIVEDVTVDGSSVYDDLSFSGTTASYTFPALDADHTLKATFKDMGTGDSCIRVDQTENGGQWNFLGTFNFAAGATASVVLENEPDDGDYTVADAVRFEQVDGDVDIIIDNEAPGNAGFSRSSGWTPSSISDGYDSAISGFSSESYHSLLSDASNDGSNAMWSATIPSGQGGVYNVYASWTSSDKRAHQAPYCVSGHGGRIYAITASAEANGSIAPDGYTEYAKNSQPEYTITPNAGHVIEDVLVDGQSVYADLVFTDKAAVYTFPALINSHAIVAVFEDHGDSCLTATTISCDPPTAIGGDIQTPGEYDYFEFTIDKRKSVTVNTTGTTDTYGYLYMADCEQEIEDDDNDYDDDVNFLIKQELDAGTYYIAVRHRSATETGAYTLHLECEPDQGEDCASAQEIKCGTSISGTLTGPNDLDYYKITELPDGIPSYVTIKTTGDADTQGWLLSDDLGCDVDGTANPGSDQRIDYNDDSVDSNFLIEREEQAKELAAGESYYVRVRRKWKNNPPPYPWSYALSVECRAATRNITAIVGPDGYITPPEDGSEAHEHKVSRTFDVEVEYDASQTFTFTPKTNYQVEKVIVDGEVQTSTPNEYTFENVTANHTIEVKFGVQDCSEDCLECTPGEPDCDDCSPCERPAECIRMNQDNNGGQWHFVGSFVFVPGSGGYVEVKREKDTVITDSSDPNFDQDAYENREYTIADAVQFVNIDNGDTVIVDNGDDGYSESDGWGNVGGSDKYDGDGRYTYTKGATATFRPQIPSYGTYQVHAWWPTRSRGDNEASYCVYSHVGRAPLIEASSGEHGDIDPSGTTTVTPGDSATFTMTPSDSSQYYIAAVTVDGEAQAVNPDDEDLGYIFTIDPDTNEGEYTFLNVTQDHTIAVRWDDHGDSCFDTQTTIGCNETANGTIDMGGDGDFFKLDLSGLSEGRTVNIFTTSDPVVDTYGLLFNSNCTSVLDSNDDGAVDSPCPGNRNFCIERVLQPGVYYVKVKHYDNASGTGAYTLNVVCDAAPADVTITVDAGEHGEITRSDNVPIDNNQVTVPYGDDIAFDITPEDASIYCIDEVSVKPTDGDEDQRIYLGDLTSYAFEYVEQNWTLSASFVLCDDGGTPVEPPVAEEVSCVDISDVPLNVQIESAPPLVMFLMDDSGSMDMSINTGIGDGKHEGFAYVFDEAHGDHTFYHEDGVLDDRERRFWQLQWAEHNKMYYSPNTIYEPWPDLEGGVTNLAAPGNADPDTPLSDPTEASTPFDMTNCEECVMVNQRIEDSGGEWNQLGAFEFKPGEVKIMITGGDGSTCADAVRIEKVDGGVEDIIVDNDDAGFAIISGDWESSAGLHGWDPSISDFADGDGESFYTYAGMAAWTVTIAEAGAYNVYASWTYRDSRNENAPYCISGYDSGGNQYDITGNNDLCRTGMSADYVWIHEIGGERLTVERARIDEGGGAMADDNEETAADAIALVPVANWRQGVAIEEQQGVIIIDNKDPNFIIEGDWNTSNATDRYGPDSLYTSDNGAQATWLIDVASGDYYIFINASKKEKIDCDPDPENTDSVWGYWDMTTYQWITANNDASDDNDYERARQAPYTVYSNGGHTVTGVDEDAGMRIDQMEGKPDLPSFDSSDHSNWNTRWQEYWHTQWNGGKYFDGAGTIQDRDDAATRWCTDSDDNIISPPTRKDGATWGWNGLDWIPLGTGNPGKVFTFTGLMEDGEARERHAIPNAHYYAVDNTGEIWLVEIVKGDSSAPAPDDADHINYFLFKDNSIIDPSDPDNFYGDEDYVEMGELTLTDAADVPLEIRTYTDANGQKRDLTYTWARQNFANWYSYYRRRELTVKAAVGLVIADSERLMMGLHTINNPAGTSEEVRPVIVEDDAGTLDERKQLLETLYGFDSNGNTPLRRGLERIGEYYSGNQPDGLDLILPYWAADQGGECQHAFVIAMTDGYWNGDAPENVKNEDGNADNEPFDGPPFGDDFGNGTGNKEGGTLADVAMKYYEADINADLEDHVPNRSNDSAEHQHMVTYGVAFGVTGTIDPNDYLDCPPNCPEWTDPFSGDSKRKIDDLYHASVNGRGSFLSADNPEELVKALKKLVSEMESSAGAGASVTTNTGQLKEGAVVFQGLFQSDGWSGDVLAYDLDPETGEVITDPIKWSAAEELTKKMESQADDTHERLIFTLDRVEDPFSDTILNGTPFRYDNLTESARNELGSDEEDIKLVINYIRGDHANEIGGDPGGDFRARSLVQGTGERTKLGDIIHSPTLNVHYEKDADGNPYDVLYVGGNDGMLHAFDSDTGEELWGYIPNLMFTNGKLRALTDKDYTHQYYVDGAQYAKNIKDRRNDGAMDKIMLVGALGKGGKGIYCLDITRPKGNIGFGGFSETAAAGNIANWEYPVKYEKDSDGNVVEFINAGKLEYTYEGLPAVTKLRTGDLVMGNISKATAVIADIDTKEQIATLYGVEKGETGLLFQKNEIIEQQDCTENCGKAKVQIRDSRENVLFGTTNDADMGYSFSRPFIVDTYAGCNEINPNECDPAFAVFFGNGYESLRGHAVLYAIILDNTGKIARDAMSGKLKVYKIDTHPEEYTDDTRECNGLSTPSLVDSDLDKKVDFAYAGDLLGNLWKFDLRDPNPENWHVAYQHKDSTEDNPMPRPFFQAVNADGDGNRQPITTQPEVVIPCEANQKGFFVSFGTGRYLGDADFDDTSTQSTYGLWDWQAEWEDVKKASCDEDDFECIATAEKEASWKYLGKMEKDNSTPPANCQAVGPDCCASDPDCDKTCVTDSRALSNQSAVRLVRQTSESYTVTVDVVQKDTDDNPILDADNNPVTLPEEITYEVLSDNTPTWYSPKSTEGCHVGWYFDLPISRERITSDPILRDGVAYFVSTVPSDTPCVAGGTSTFWGANACTGGRITEPLFDINGDGVINEHDLINIGTEENPIWVAPTGLHFDSYLYAPSFISVPGGGAMGLLGGMTKDIETQLSTSGGYGVYYWKERD